MPLKERSKESGILSLIGTNHNYSPITIREKCAFPTDNLDIYLKEVKSIPSIREVMIVSTCNRTEIITVSSSDVIPDIIEYLSEHSGIPIGELKGYLYVKKDLDVVKHIFRVASGLDSMVVGEPQILGQIKESYRWSVDFMASGAVLNRIMRRAFHVAKLIRSRTNIGKGAVSIAYAALIKAKNTTNIRSKRMMLVGVGGMSRLAAEHFSSSGVRITHIANRTIENARELSKKYGAKIIPLNDIANHVNSVDIIFTSTSSEKPILLPETFSKKRGKLLIIDTAIPRDVDETVGEMENITLIYLDDLKNIIENTKLMRGKQLETAESIIEAELESYISYVESMDYNNVIAKIREMADRTRKLEVKRFLRKHKELDDKCANDVDKMTNAIVKKILHDPTMNIREFIDHPEGDLYIELLKRVFNLEDKKKDVKCFFSENP